MTRNSISLAIRWCWLDVPVGICRWWRDLIGLLPSVGEGRIQLFRSWNGNRSFARFTGQYRTHPYGDDYVEVCLGQHSDIQGRVRLSFY
jgi:hypothetical protein